MPQMDTATFLPQVFWLVVVFFTFYLIVLNNILPGLSQILKARSKKLSQGKELFDGMKEDKEGASAAFNLDFADSSKESSLEVQGTSNSAFAWVDKELEAAAGKNAEEDAAQKMNLSYLKNLSDLRGKKNIIASLSA